MQACQAKLPHVIVKPLQTIASELAAAGAVLHVLCPTPAVYLVGDLQWITPRRVFWFTAHGDRPDDGHVLDFDAANVVAATSVEFVWDGRVVAHLTAIPFADVDDADDYAVAFSIWQQVGPSYRTRIEQALTTALADFDQTRDVPQPQVTAGNANAIRSENGAQFAESAAGLIR